MRAILLSAGVLLLFSSRAAAQQADEGRIRLEGPSWAAAARGSYLLRPCPGEREHSVAFCLGDEAPLSPIVKRFTRLAGMLIGRAEALTVGSWRVRFSLALR